ncbi:MAG: hypothetical protein LDLANPLL_00454 [Turneriella sp.]|nr:hypothetical protein [Turneriella sp.]
MPARSTLAYYLQNLQPYKIEDLRKIPKKIVATISGFGHIVQPAGFSQKDYEDLGTFEAGIPDAWIFVIDANQKVTGCVLIEAKDNDTGATIEQIGSYARTFLNINSFQEYQAHLVTNTWRGILESMEQAIANSNEVTAQNLIRNFVEVIRWYGVPIFSQLRFDLGFLNPIHFKKALLKMDLQYNNFENFPKIGVYNGNSGK